MWTLHPTFCDDVAVVGVTFETHGHNSDGIDPDSCRHFRIEKCTFSTQDDCIAIKSGKGEEGRRLARPCEDVTVTDCTFTAGHGAVSIGSEVSGGIKGVHVERCKVEKGVACALRIKSAEGRGGFIEDVTAKDLDSAAAVAVQVEMSVKYNPDPQPLPPPEGITRVAGIRVEDLKMDGGVVLDAVGLKAKPIVGLVLSHVSGTCKKGPDDPPRHRRRAERHHRYRLRRAEADRGGRPGHRPRRSGPGPGEAMTPDPNAADGPALIH